MAFCFFCIFDIHQERGSHGVTSAELRFVFQILETPQRLRAHLAVLRPRKVFAGSLTLMQQGVPVWVWMKWKKCTANSKKLPGYLSCRKGSIELLFAFTSREKNGTLTISCVFLCYNRWEGMVMKLYFDVMPYDLLFNVLYQIRARSPWNIATSSMDLRSWDDVNIFYSI